MASNRIRVRIRILTAWRLVRSSTRLRHLREESAKRGPFHQTARHLLLTNRSGQHAAVQPPGGGLRSAARCGPPSETYHGHPPTLVDERGQTCDETLDLYLLEQVEVNDLQPKSPFEDRLPWH